MTGPNAHLLRETMDAVLSADAEGLWRQRNWIVETPCGTAGCFAGWRAFLDGFTRDTGDRYHELASDASGESVHIYRYAAERLGLTEGQADRLFRGGNTLAELKHIVDEICEGQS